ncbi:MAG: FAD-binding oxidoreductase [Leptospiraceae bacterium]|nr:FAD-binding oxidoreductase [Leptospiraceae bacterium]
MKTNLRAALDELDSIQGLHIIRELSELQHLATDRTGAGAGFPLALVEPESTEEVQQIVRICRKHSVALVPQGGRTGYAGGACSMGEDLLLSLGRMNRILSLDPYLPALQVEAGCITRAVQSYALEHGYYFPVDFASAGSSQIGGNAATNAGGIRLIRYGGMRQHVLGLKAVTGTGEILETNGHILKDNTGYDLRDLIVGSEGTLAIITELTLSLTSPPPESLVLLCALPDLSRILDLLGHCRKLGLDLHAFEFFDGNCLQSVMQYNDLENPFPELKFDQNSGWFCLLECTASDTATEQLLESEQLHQICLDVLPAQSDSGKKKFWSYRENISESLSHGPVHKNDISIPLASIPVYVQTLEAMLRQDYGDMKSFLFGHIGDGNIHINLKPLKGEGEGPQKEFSLRCKKFDEDNTHHILRFQGSISAEHGIGLLKKDSLQKVRDDRYIRWMKEIKSAFDPDGILNPGKIFS